MAENLHEANGAAIWRGPPSYWERKIYNRTDIEDQKALRQLVQGKKLIVEVGTFVGGTAETMLGTMDEDAHLVTMDPYQEMPYVNFIEFVRSEVIMSATSRLAKYGDRVSHIIGDSRRVAPLFRDDSIDMVFIDGDHRYEAVSADIHAWAPKVRPSGVIAGHDFNAQAAFLAPAYIESMSHLDRDRETGVHCGVVKAVLQCFSEFKRPESQISSVWWADKEWYLGR